MNALTSHMSPSRDAGKDVRVIQVPSQVALGWGHMEVGPGDGDSGSRQRGPGFSPAVSLSMSLKVRFFWASKL